MANLLGIDFGTSKVGVAFAAGKLAEPISVIHYDGLDELLIKIKKIVSQENISEVIVGISEGESKNKALKFGKQLSEYLLLPVHFEDETLSSKDAQAMSIAAGISRKRRKKMEDAYAATLILQNYLDK